MRGTVLALAITMAGAGFGAAAQETPEATIRAQIEAFGRDDFAAAFEYASPALQGIFRTLERFGMMVMDGYPMVWRPEELRMLGAEDVPGGVVQRIGVVGPDGAYHELDYRMRPVAGGWVIEGVRILDPMENSV
ncbi:uncharacterized protein DUF4864 [Hasllibacter halocynthiae]|uniref:Uncharacterized protein DUF4864 n=1 Tax=Hasllibacter halocynthiae TaxID=595589 RepID=A0A2T0X1Z4_9RHOB|nr:DUF4864 domain-containing protein [Hasllibacter halocynthiae]PRY92958.1 uncharacterized protein DUF4864 [Hasllibacter halocynthiae]